MAQNAVSNKKLRRTWVTRQLFSSWNIISAIIFGGLAIAPIEVVVSVVLGISVIAALFKIPSMVITAIIISIITFIFPPLAAIITIVFLLMKFAYIVEHFRPLLIGVGLGLYLIYSAQDFYYPSAYMLSHLLFSIMLFQVVLIYLYRKEYSAKEAVTIIATVPLFLVMLILPFLLSQLEEMADVFDVDSYDYFVQERVPSTPNPDTHWVEGHIRENADGSSSYVDSHIRTNPDGIKGNNLS